MLQSRPSRAAVTKRVAAPEPPKSERLRSRLLMKTCEKDRSHLTALDRRILRHIFVFKYIVIILFAVIVLRIGQNSQLLTTNVVLLQWFFNCCCPASHFNPWISPAPGPSSSGWKCSLGSWWWWWPPIMHLKVHIEINIKHKITTKNKSTNITKNF